MVKQTRLVYCVRKTVIMAIYRCIKRKPDEHECCTVCPLNFGIDHKHHWTLNHYHGHGTTWIYYDINDESDPGSGGDHPTCPVWERKTCLMSKDPNERR
ncbi:MAG: hypothetical protein ACXADH_11120 [Candidatus Kariarchaeaceae archaeon]|jgi:hypothetical protein